MTTWKRRLRSRRWIGTWLNSERSTRTLDRLVAFALIAATLSTTIWLGHQKHADQTQILIFEVAAFAFVVAIMTSRPRREVRRLELEERRHRRRVEQRLARLVGLLEQRELGGVEQPLQPAPRPRASLWLVILVGVAVGWRCINGKPRR